MIKTEDIKILYSEQELISGIQALANKLNKLYAGEDVVLIGVLTGAVMFTVDLAKRLDMPLRMVFIKVSSYGSDTVSSGNVQVQNIKLPDLNGKNVVISEDIIDTGHTAKFITDFIKSNYDVKSLKFCTLLDKKARREVDIEADYSVFEIDDKFVVGYGLDYDEKFRNLPYVGYIEV